MEQVYVKKYMYIAEIITHTVYQIYSNLKCSPVISSIAGEQLLFKGRAGVGGWASGGWGVVSNRAHGVHMVCTAQPNLNKYLNICVHTIAKHPQIYMIYYEYYEACTNFYYFTFRKINFSPS